MQILLDAVANDLEAALASVGVKGDLWQRVIGPARERKEGDIALPCFPFAKMVGLPPAEIAEAVAAAMNQHEALSEVRATNGYLNLVANPAWLAAQLLDDAGPLGAPVAPEDGLVLIEHTSANPNGPFHVGRARNAILGDTLVRLNRLAGRNVRAEYYVDDMGKQVGVLAWALANLTEADVSAALSVRFLVCPRREKGLAAELIGSSSANHPICLGSQALRCRPCLKRTPHRLRFPSDSPHAIASTLSLYGNRTPYCVRLQTSHQAPNPGYRFFASHFPNRVSS